MNDILAAIQLCATIGGFVSQVAAFANRTEAGLEMGSSWRGFFAIGTNYTARGRIYWWLSGLSFAVVGAIALYQTLA